MTNIIDKTGAPKLGGVFSETHRTVVVHDGTRGPEGQPGPRGPDGDQGDSINVLGRWEIDNTYCPLDAVSWRSSVVDHVNSLYVQKSDQPCSVSTLPPNEDLGRWDEIGAVDWDNAFGGIWHVYQLNHGFTKIGQPVGYSFQADEYVLADSRRLDELAICVVREVIDADRVVLQSSGEVPNIDETIIFPDGEAWEPGRVYYVHTIRGRLSIDVPGDSNYYSNAILMATDVWAPDGGVTGRNGVALPWTPVGGPGSQDYITVGWLKFYFTITNAGQLNVTGLDDRGRTLEYQVNDNTDVFLNGVNLISSDDFVASDGFTVQFPNGLRIGDVVEIWTPDRPLDVIVPSTVLKLDNIEHLFDGVRTTFPLTVGTATIEVQSANNIMIWLDVNPQEAMVDFAIIEDPAQPGTLISVVEFTQAPEADTRFWGTALQPQNKVVITIPPWQAGEIYPIDDVVSAVDPAAPDRGWQAIWRNDSGAEIAPSPIFGGELQGWTIISRPLAWEVLGGGGDAEGLLGIKVPVVGLATGDWQQIATIQAFTGGTFHLATDQAGNAPAMAIDVINAYTVSSSYVAVKHSFNTNVPIDQVVLTAANNNGGVVGVWIHWAASSAPDFDMGITFVGAGSRLLVSEGAVVLNDPPIIQAAAPGNQRVVVDITERKGTYFPSDLVVGGDMVIEGIGSMTGDATTDDHIITKKDIKRIGWINSGMGGTSNLVAGILNIFGDTGTWEKRQMVTNGLFSLSSNSRLLATVNIAVDMEFMISNLSVTGSGRQIYPVRSTDGGATWVQYGSPKANWWLNTPFGNPGQTRRFIWHVNAGEMFSWWANNTMTIEDRYSRIMVYER